MKSFILLLALTTLAGKPSGNCNFHFLTQEGEPGLSWSQTSDSLWIRGIPDSVSYLADFALMSESISLMMGEEQHSASVAKKSAPFYLFPSPGIRQDLDKLQPLLMESLDLKARIAASASAFDAAWEEVITCASLESEEGVRSALAIAFQHKDELDMLQKKQEVVSGKLKQVGEPRDPVKEYKKIQDEYKSHQESVYKTVSKKPVVVAPVPEKGHYQLAGIKNVRGDEYVKVSKESGIVKSEVTASDYEGVEFTAPEVIQPGEKVTIKLKLEFRTIEQPFFMRGSTYVLRLFYGASPIKGGTSNYDLCRVWSYVPVHADEKQRLIVQKNLEDQCVISLPNRNHILQAIRDKKNPQWKIPLPDQMVYFNTPMAFSSILPMNIPMVEYDLIELYDHTNSADMKMLTEDSKRAVFQLVGGAFNTVVTYEWVDDGAPVADAADALAEKAKKQKLAEMDGNIAFIRGNIRSYREQLEKEGDPAIRAKLSYQIMTSEADIQTEEDLKKSVETGQYVHTRTTFDDFVRGQFIENIRTEQMRMEEFQRCSASLQRLAALLPPADADGARDFIARQIAPADVMNMDVAKLRKMADILYKQVEARAAQDVAKGEEEVAEVGLTWASRAKAAADGGLMVTSIVAGPWLNVAYQGATGAWDGGLTEGIVRAASSYTMPSFLAAQAYQGYKAGGWTQAGQNVAISFVTGKVIKYGLAKSLSAVGKLIKPTTQEAFELAKFNQARQQGEALVKSLQRAEAEVIRQRVAVRRGDKGAADKLKQALAAREAQAAAVHENMHAKNYLKYKGDYHTRKIFTEDLDQIHQKTQEKFHSTMQSNGWGKTPLKEFRNASSAGTSGMDYDIGLDEQIAGALMKNGTRATLQQWQKEAQSAWNKAYKEVTGRSAVRSWETVTTSAHPEAYKDLAWLSGNPGAVSKLWTQQGVDVTRFKNWHMMKDPNLSVYEKLQEMSRGSAKDMQTKLLSNLSKMANAGGPNAPALKKANEHWRKVFGVLDKFGKGDMDPVTASRKIREMTGGKSIAEALDDMTTLMETVGKL
jgi:hypothetical protein